MGETRVTRRALIPPGKKQRRISGVNGSIILKCVLEQQTEYIHSLDVVHNNFLPNVIMLFGFSILL
jgi:hypothetical protein